MPYAVLQMSPCIPAPALHCPSLTRYHSGLQPRDPGRDPRRTPRVPTCSTARMSNTALASPRFASTASSRRPSARRATPGSRSRSMLLSPPHEEEPGLPRRLPARSWLHLWARTMT